LGGRSRNGNVTVACGTNRKHYFRFDLERGGRKRKVLGQKGKRKGKAWKTENENIAIAKDEDEWGTLGRKKNPSDATSIYLKVGNNSTGK